MMSVEMIGTFSDAENSQDYPLGFLQWLYPNRGNFIALVGRFDETFLLRRLRRAMRSASALPVEALAAPKSVEGLDFSDHLNYWAAGYPAVMLTDTAFLRNPRYHTAEDTPERLDYPKMAQVIQGIYAAILAEQ
jgi:hypothetical protein